MDEQPVRVYRLPAATITEYASHIHTKLIDGSECINAPVEGILYGKVAEEMGFPATVEGKMRYAAMHEIAHHIVAAQSREFEIWMDDETLVPLSRIIYNACHEIPQSMEQQFAKDEEHLTNRLMRFTMLGEGDPYGELERVFGNCLPELARELVRVGMPWLAKETL